MLASNCAVPSALSAALLSPLALLTAGFLAIMAGCAIYYGWKD